SFGGHSSRIRLEIPGEHYQVGQIDKEAGPISELLQMTPQQQATRVWKPDDETWARIKRDTVKSPATITFTGFSDDTLQQPVSAGSVNIFTAADPVGAPIYYRDVPLMLWPRSEKGAIQPLPPFAVPLIKWKLRSIAQAQSKVVMEKLVTCANCHSFSND